MIRKPSETGGAIRPNNLLVLMQRDGVTQADIARAWGVENADAWQRVHGKVRITQDRARVLTKKFGWTASEIYDGLQDAPAIKIPIRGSVPGGLPMEVVEVPPDEYVYYTLRKGNPKNIGALRVIGDSMNNIAPDGAYVIVDFSKTTAQDLDGKPVIAYADGESTFKRLCLDPNLLIPDSTNKHHKPLVLNGEWRILGQVVGVINTLEE